MRDAGYKGSFPAFPRGRNHVVECATAGAYVMLNNGVANAALANVVVQTSREVLDVCLAPGIIRHRESLLGPSHQLFDATDLAVVEVDGGVVFDQRPNA